VHTTRKVPFIDRQSFWPGRVMGIFLLALALAGCKRSPEPVTITFLDPEGLSDLGDHRMVSDEYLREFTRQTGIRVNHLPTPQDDRAQFQLIRELLQGGTSTPDVYGIDTIWSGALSEYLVDLRPYFSAQLPALDPELLGSYVVQGKLVALPYHPSMGVLYYRADLLRRYGYGAPPETWDELETMAVRIQKGERARGQKDFWGFVWPGTQSEPLSCQGMEWQVGEGGGRIIELDRKISVNNPDVIRAWGRAAHWVDWISPPSVVSYTDWDAQNAFWISGKAAFQRGWSDYVTHHQPDLPFRQVAGVTSLPAGRSGRVSTLGGYALGVSRSSVHRAEAIKLVDFLTRSEAQHQAAYSHSEPPWQLQFHELPTALAKIYPWSEKAAGRPGATLVSRPSAVARTNYYEVSGAYVRAVHSVLARQSTAPAAAAALEKELARITGFAVSSADPRSRPRIPVEADRRVSRPAQ
jgi:trehalose/maltose transport system substrate-binding protein